MIKKQLLALVTVAGITIVSCTKKEYVDVKPQLEIHVFSDSLYTQKVEGASVYLYPTIQGFKLRNKIVVDSSITNENGVALFQNLEEKVYFFYAKKDALHNFFGISTFKDSLKINHIKSIKTYIQ